MSDITATVAAIAPLTERIRALTLKGTGPLPAYAPGAHIRIALPDGDTRAYSLIDFAPTQSPQHYTIAVQLEENGQGGSRHMHALVVGDTVQFAPPKCDFALVDAPALFLAGGIGVTPMISMAAALEQPFAFHYAGRSADLMAYRDDVIARFAAQIHCDDTPSKLDLAALIATLAPAQHLYVCGPRGMIDATRTLAEQAGIDHARIHFELFDNAAAQSDDSAFEVQVQSTGQVFTVAPDQTIIEALEDGGVDVIYDCQRGDCGICQCDVI
ncbi:MAG: 2Fe-2S iron-sulfur cluster-binding protein [Sedimentitalea sp.]